MISELPTNETVRQHCTVYLCYTRMSTDGTWWGCGIVEVFPTSSGEGAAAITPCRLCCDRAVVDCADRVHRWRRHKGLVLLFLILVFQ